MQLYKSVTWFLSRRAVQGLSLSPALFFTPIKVLSLKLPWEFKNVFHNALIYKYFS